MEKHELLSKINKDNKFVISCLVALSNAENGFNQKDRKNMINISKHLDKVTEMQLRLVRRKLKKYHKELLILKIKPVQFKAVNKKAVDGKKIIRLEQSLLIIEFPYEDILLKKHIKFKVRAKWNKPIKKKWSVIPTYDTIKDLMEMEFLLTEEVKTIWNKYFPEHIKLTSPLPLRPYQHEGFEWLETYNGRGILGDEMGLGKTIQALAWLYYRTDVRPVMVTMPNTAKLNWARECQMWIPEASVQVIRGRGDQVAEADIVLINNDVIFDTIEKLVSKRKLVKGKWETTKVKANVGIPRDFLKKAKFKAIIVDELQNYKNPNSLRTQALTKLVKKIPHLIGLSGTPIKNRPIEFFHFLKMVDKTKWPSKWEFAEKYCDLTNNGFGWDYSGSSNMKGLYEKLQGTMLRRLKKNVLKELPPKTRTVISIEGTKAEMNKYYKTEQDLIHWLKTGPEKAKALTMIEDLKQKAMKIKLKHCIDWIEQYLEEFPKLVVFAHHRSVINDLSGYFKKRAVTIIGGDSINKRQTAIDRFQTDPSVNVFLGSIIACKEAITLTAAKDTVTVELLWEPADHLQAEDRVHRIGQENDNVGAYYLVLNNSIEMKIALQLDEKVKVLTQILDGKEAKPEDLLVSLLNSYNENSV